MIKTVCVFCPRFLAVGESHLSRIHEKSGWTIVGVLFPASKKYRAVKNSSQTHIQIYKGVCQGGAMQSKNPKIMAQPFVTVLFILANENTSRRKKGIHTFVIICVCVPIIS